MRSWNRTFRSAYCIGPHQLDRNRTRSVDERDFFHHFAQVWARQRHRDVAYLFARDLIVDPRDPPLLNIGVSARLDQFMVEGRYDIFPRLVEGHDAVIPLGEDTDRIVDPRGSDTNRTVESAQPFKRARLFFSLA